MIIIYPTAGLCNRMRLINSAIHLAKINKQNKIKMIWNKDNLLNANFEDLFEPIDMIYSIKKSYIYNYFSYYEGVKNQSFSFGIKKKLLELNAYRYKFYNDETIKKIRGNEDYWRLNHKNVIFNTCYDFFDYDISKNYYQLFKPVQDLQLRISKLTQCFSGFPIVGIHIRRTDNEIAIKTSSTSFFLRRVETILKNNNTTRFFLSTDDPSIEELFVSQFGNLVFFQINKELSRNSKKGIEDAVVDLFTLSNTELIIGSYWSSFTLVSSWINNTPLEILK